MPESENTPTLGEAHAVLARRLATPVGVANSERYAADALAHHARELAALLRSDADDLAVEGEHTTPREWRAAADRLDRYADELAAEHRGPDIAPRPPARPGSVTALLDHVASQLDEQPEPGQQCTGGAAIDHDETGVCAHGPQPLDDEQEALGDHRLVLTLDATGHADIKSNMHPLAAAAALRSIADGLEHSHTDAVLAPVLDELRQHRPDTPEADQDGASQ